MNTLRIVALFLFFGVNHNLLADDSECTTVTNAIQFSQADKTHILEQVQLKTSTRAFTFFTNGDLLIANVEECGLGLELLYLSQQPFDSMEARAEKLRWLVNLNGRDVASLLPKKELVKSTYDFSVNGDYSDEKHVVKSALIISTTDIFPETFSDSISYIWIAPSGAE